MLGKIQGGSIGEISDAEGDAVCGSQGDSASRYSLWAARLRGQWDQVVDKATLNKCMALEHEDHGSVL